jgi:hypothetical protein
MYVEGKVDNEIDGLKKMTHIYDIQLFATLVNI